MTDESPVSTKFGRAHRAVEASYRRVESETWRDNPLIEALPPVLTDQEFSRLARFFPPHDDKIRDTPKHVRLMHVQRVMQFFMPMETHLLLSQRFARIIRDGYVARNPLEDMGFSRLPKQLEDLAERMQYGIAPHEPTSGMGFAIIGIGGVGKTTGVNAVLRTYPRVIVHRSYTDSSGREHRLTRTQIVAVKIDCPEDGTLKSLCLKFFRTVDDLIGFTNYYKEYGYRGTTLRTATDMLPDMARVAALHAVGVLIIDEIQFLSKQKSGGREQMLQFFTRLVNEIKLPVVLIGTPRAQEVLNGAFWQMRRNAGQGEFYWAPMKQDFQWERFLASMWRYQYVLNPAKLTNDGRVPKSISDALYRESQGIADFAAKMFMIAQERAINSNFERITPELIEVVARDSFGNAREIIQGIRTNRRVVLARVDDVDLSSEHFRESTENTPSQASFAATTPAATSVVTPLLPAVNPRGSPDDLEPVMPNLVQDALARGETGAQALRAAGYVRPATEFGL